MSNCDQFYIKLSGKQLYMNIINSSNSSSSKKSGSGSAKSRRLVLLTFFKRMTIWLGLIILGIYLAVWAFSPTVANWQINKQLKPFQLKLNDDATIRFNPFILKLSLDKVELTANGSEQVLASMLSAAIDINAFALFANEIAFERVEFVDLLVKVQRSESDIVFAGFKLPNEAESSQKIGPEISELAPDDKSASKTDKGWSLSADKIDFNQVIFSIDNLKNHHEIVINHLNLARLNLSQIAQKMTLDLNALIDGAPLKINGRLKNEVVGGEIDLTVDLQRLQLAKESYWLKPMVNQISGQLDLSFQQSLRFKGSEVKVLMPSAKLSITDFNVSALGLEIANQSLSNQLSDVVVAISPGNSPQISAGYSFNSQQTDVTDNESGDLLLSIAQLNLASSKISLDKQLTPNIEFEELSIDNIIAFRKLVKTQQKTEISSEPAFAEIHQLMVKDFALADQHLSLSVIEIQRFIGNVILDKNKQLANLVLPDLKTQNKPVVAVENNQKEPHKQSQEQPQALTFSLDKLIFSGDSQLTFKDKSISPEFLQKIQINTLSVENIDNRKPDNVSNIKLEVKIDEYASAKIIGSIQPFTEKINLDVVSTVKEFSLPEVSPYLKATLGFDLLSGQFDTDIKLKIVEDMIKGESHIAVRGLEISTAESGEVNTLKGQSSMPLNSALNMLKDDKGNLTLDVPLNGDVSNPEFGISGFIGLITKKAIMSAAESYLINTFVPYANVISVVRIAGEYMLKVSFENLNYSPTIVDIQPEQLAFVDQFIKLLKDKPDTQVKICAIAVPTELTGQVNDLEDGKLLEQLKQISYQRGQAFKAWVVEKGAIDSSRLLLCQPQIDKTKEAKPRIEFEV